MSEPLPGEPSPVNSTRFAQLTPTGRSAVASIAVWGPGVTACLSHFFRPQHSRSLEEDGPGSVRYGRWQTGQGEDLVLTCIAADRWEIHCHGGHAAPEAIQADLESVGARRESVAQWAATAGLAPPYPRAREAELCLPRAKTLKTSLLLLDQMSGALDRELDELIGQLTLGQRYAVELNAGAKRLAALMARGRWGIRWEQPWKICLVGPPNVGKSSLTNRLLGYERSIVHAEPGTTRDCVSADSALDGWPVEFSDTAGLRATPDELEQAGIARAEALMESADLLLWVGDARDRQTVGDYLPGHPGVSPQNYPLKSLIVWNKVDLLPAACSLPNFAGGTASPSCADDPLQRTEVGNSAGPPEHWVSAATGAGLPELMQAMVAHGLGEPPPSGAAVPFRGWQLAVLERSAACLAAGNVSSAIQVLAELQRPA